MHMWGGLPEEEKKNVLLSYDGVHNETIHRNQLLGRELKTISVDIWHRVLMPHFL